MEIVQSPFNINAFIVKTKNQNGTPLGVNGIQVSITAGSLSTSIVNTDSVTGESPEVIVSGTSNGTIYAQGRAIIPVGVSFVKPGSQRVVNTLPNFGTLKVEADWGVLPVELASFNSIVSGRNVELNWATASELNNSGFELERSEVRGQTSNEWTKIGAVTGNGTSSSGHSYSYTDRNLASGNYNYRLKQIDFNGNFEYFNLSNEVIIGIPSKFELSQNYPNPFNPATKLEFGISELALVSLKVYDASGKEVATLVNEIKTAGYYTVNFNGSNLSSGIYFYTLETNNFKSTKRMMLLK